MSDINWSVVDVKQRFVGYDLVISKHGRFSFGTKFSNYLISNRLFYVTFMKTNFKGQIYFGFKFHKKYVADSLKIVKLSSKSINVCFYCKGFLKFLLDNSSCSLEKSLSFNLLKDNDYNVWYFALNDRQVESKK